MTETRDCIWVIPLVAGFFAIIAILSPTAFCNNHNCFLSSYYGYDSWDWWMWNFTTMNGSSGSLFSLEFIIPSLITTSAILLSAINLLILSIRTRRRNLNTKHFALTSIISAVLSIGIMIYYIIAMDIAFYNGYTIDGIIIFPAGYHFWDEFQPGFGIFLPFISAALSFIGGGVFRYYSKRKEDIVPPKMDNIWVIPLVAGLFAIIAILSPTAFYYHRNYIFNSVPRSFRVVTWDWWNWWMWNFTTIVDHSISLFISEGDFIIPSIITTSAVLFSAVNLFILSIRTRRRNLNTKYFKLTSIISAVLSIGIMIYYIIAMDIAFYDGLTIDGIIIREGTHFWDVFQPGFGIFLPFISAALSFIGVGVFRYYSKRK